MEHPTHPLARIWHQTRARPRLASSILLGASLFTGLPPSFETTTRALVARDFNTTLLALAINIAGGQLG